MATSEGVLVGSPERPNRPRAPRRWGRRLLVLIAVLLVLALLLVGGGAWYYSGQIGSEALTADHQAHPPRYDLVVEAVDGTSVVLRRTGETPADDPLASGYPCGLRCPGGAGVRSGPPVQGFGGASPRELTTTTGGRPGRGTPAALDGNVWA